MFVRWGESMNELPRQKLCELIAQYGQALCEDTKRCNALLKEQCGAYKTEVRILVGAATEEIPDELLTAPPEEPRPDLLARLTRQLQDALDVPEADARWSVESWAIALKVIPAPEPAAPPAPPAQTAEPEPAPLPVPKPAPAGDLERPESFYLGREYDLATRTIDTGKRIEYDARDLLTHGVVVGMTGSGKTGLCITLIEEAALDNIPCILIDPKGDLTNLLLQFPDLRPEDFQPWLNPEDARQKGITLEEYAQQLSVNWRKGLAESGQAPERIARLKEKAEFRIYTPGSEAGLPLSILQTFTAPKGPANNEVLNQKTAATTTALLGLTGITSDPVQSREHILISQLLLQAWKKGHDLDLAQLIAEIQAPSLVRIGTLDVDTFYPEKERLKLAVALNNILASPSFSTWITGEPLDLSRMLYSPAGKPRQLIFYVAHLDDAQRMFFISLLLEEVLAWTRKQSGTTGLRAILYFDEVFGFLPPHPHNPPTKEPLMRLLKQARAFGVGILLATQNPVDLDYKALSNAGTWFVGKLQTERDKARLLEGLEGVSAERGTLSNRSYLETVISALGNRVFLLHDVHRGQPLLFQSRWALSFLRGPITSEQIGLLMEPFKQQQETLPPAVAAPPAPKAQPEQVPLRAVASGNPAPAAASTSGAPVLNGVTQYYLARSSPAEPAGPHRLVYQLGLMACADVLFADRRKGLEIRKSVCYLVAAPESGQTMNWHAAEASTVPPAETPEPGAHWADVPESLNAARKVMALKKSFADFLYGNLRLNLFANTELGLVSQPDEKEDAFRRRCEEAAGQELARALENEKLRYEPRFKALNTNIGEAESPPSSSGSWLSMLSFPPLPFSTPAPQRSAKEQAKLENLAKEWGEKRKALAEKWQRIGATCSALELTPRKADVQVTHFGLAWTPFWNVTGSDGREEFVPA